MTNLPEEINSLPEEIQPQNDLWPDIKRRILRKKRNTQALLAFAGALLVCGASAAVVLYLRNYPAQYSENNLKSRFSAVLSTLERMEAQYSQIRSELLSLIDSKQEALKDEDRSMIHSSIAAIEANLADIKMILEENQTSHSLILALAGRYREEYRLLSKTARFLNDALVLKGE